MNHLYTVNRMFWSITDVPRGISLINLSGHASKFSKKDTSNICQSHFIWENGSVFFTSDGTVAIDDTQIVMRIVGV